tara:strand:+ start:4218 stop:4544 length:327 start_codon:yes stop_codon:yes gene_type:complete
MDDSSEKKTDPTVESVIAKFNERSSLGIKKYGTTLRDNDLTFIEWLTHLQEELMDATLYTQKLKEELYHSSKFPEGHVITKESWDNADKISHNGFVYVKYTDLIFYKE